MKENPGRRVERIIEMKRQRDENNYKWGKLLEIREEKAVDFNGETKESGL